jgi:hypothetical protein
MKRCEYSPNSAQPGSHHDGHTSVLCQQLAWVDSCVMSLPSPWQSPWQAPHPLVHDCTLQ